MALNGIDISNHQKGLDLSKVPCDFVICKATEGTGFVDAYCDGWFQKAFSLGKSVGTYHFATGGSSGRQEAEYYYEHTKGYVGKGLFVLDWEGNAVNKGVAYAKEFLDRFTELSGVKPLIYMSKSVCRQYDWSPVVSGDYGLWCAQYANNNVTGYQDAPWTDNKGQGAFESIAILQYTSQGSLSGYGGRLDLDKFYGDATAWAKYAKASVQTGGNGNTTAQNTTKKTIKVDGSCGSETISLWQEIVGTTVDGVISGQLVPDCKTYWRPNLVNSCVTYGGYGSSLIRAVQTRLAAEGRYSGSIDGLLGSMTIKAIQSHFGLTQDASFGPATVKALQNKLNTGSF